MTGARIQPLHVKTRDVTVPGVSGVMKLDDVLVWNVWSLGVDGWTSYRGLWMSGTNARVTATFQPSLAQAEVQNKVEQCCLSLLRMLEWRQASLLCFLHFFCVNQQRVRIHRSNKLLSYLVLPNYKTLCRESPRAQFEEGTSLEQNLNPPFSLL